MASSSAWACCVVTFGFNRPTMRRKLTELRTFRRGSASGCNGTTISVSRFGRAKLGGRTPMTVCSRSFMVNVLSITVGSPPKLRIQ